MAWTADRSRLRVLADRAAIAVSAETGSLPPRRRHTIAAARALRYRLRTGPTTGRSRMLGTPGIPIDERTSSAAPTSAADRRMPRRGPVADPGAPGSAPAGGAPSAWGPVAS